MKIPRPRYDACTEYFQELFKNVKPLRPYVIESGNEFFDDRCITIPHMAREIETEGVPVCKENVIGLDTGELDSPDALGRFFMPSDEITNPEAIPYNWWVMREDKLIEPPPWWPHRCSLRLSPVYRFKVAIWLTDLRSLDK